MFLLRYIPFVGVQFCYFPKWGVNVRAGLPFKRSSAFFKRRARPQHTTGRQTCLHPCSPSGFLFSGNGVFYSSRNPCSGHFKPAVTVIEGICYILGIDV